MSYTKEDVLKQVPSGKSLYPFQIDSVLKCLEFLEGTESNSAYLANSAGLGKSVTALLAFKMLKCQKVLIVAPAVVRLCWLEECNTWMHCPDTAVILKGSDAEEALNHSWVIISYALMADKAILKTLIEQNWDGVIFDESQALKNPSALRTKAALKHLFPACKYHLFLSATPMLRSSVDLFPTFHAISPFHFPNFDHFVFKYSNKIQVPFGCGWIYQGLKNAPELSQIMRDTFYIRYRKEDVLPELPKKVFQTILIPESNAVKIPTDAKAQELFAEKQIVIQALLEGKNVPIPKCLAEVRRLQGLLKVPFVVEFSTELLEQETPIVIFAHHRATVAALKSALHKYNPVAITGETPAKERMESIHEFQSGKTLCFIANMQSGGIGITLTASSTVIFCELDYSPAIISQSINRCNRIGSTSAQTMIYIFSVVSSIDDDINRILIRKAQEFENVCEEAST